VAVLRRRKTDDTKFAGIAGVVIEADMGIFNE
jgi:hypothetical protein